MKDSSIDKKLEPGTIVGEYGILSWLGIGGMGIVYLAEHRFRKYQIAIKFISPLEGKKALPLQRMLREADVGIRLNHPNIVKTYSTGMLETSPYIVMEYVDGKILKAFLEKENPSLEKKLSLMQSVAKAIAYAHENGVIHRDLKPSNIMVKKDGTPIVMDFGLAKSSRIHDKSLTKTGEIVGTLQYMSPEQAQGAKDIDARTDIYSLGVILYELATGQTIFNASNTLELLNDVVFCYPSLPSSLNHSIPAEIEAIILKSIEKNRKKRYATAEELAQDIENYLQRKPVKAMSTYKMQRVRYRLFFHRNAILSITLAFLLILLSVLSYMLIRMSPTSKASSIASPERIEEILDREVDHNPTEKNYSEYIDLLTNDGSYRLALQKCEEAIEWAKKKRKETAGNFLKKKADILFFSGQYQASYELCKQIIEEYKIHDGVDPIFFRISQCAFELKKFSETVKILDTIKGKPEFPPECCFYLGAGILEEVLDFVPKHEYLDQIGGTAIKERVLLDKNKLNEPVSLLLKAETGIKDERLLKRVRIYLGYCFVWQSEYRKSRDYLDKAFRDASQEEAPLMMYEALGLLSFCEKDYDKALEYFSRCIDLAPWESSYRIFRAMTYLQQKDRTVEVFLDDCFQSMYLQPSNMSALEVLVEDLLKNQPTENYLYGLKFVGDYLEKALNRIKPNLWETEYRQMAETCLQNVHSIPKSKTVSVKIMESLGRRLCHNTSESGCKIIEEIVLGMWKQEGITDVLLKVKQEYLRASGIRDSGSLDNTAIKRLEKVLNSLRSLQKEAETQNLKVALVRFIAGHDKTLLERMPNMPSLLQELLQNGNEPVLLRYWAAQTLMAIRTSETYQMLQKNCYARDKITQILSLSVLADAGFRVDCLLIPDIQTTVKGLQTDVLAILLDNLGDRLPAELCLSFLSHPDEKIKVTVSKALLNQKQNQGFDTMVQCLSSKEDAVRAYAHWHLWDTISPHFQNVSSRLLTPALANTLCASVAQDQNPIIRQIAANRMGKLSDFIQTKGFEKLREDFKNALQKAIEIEPEETVRLQLLSALIDLGELDVVFKHIINPKERFANRMTPLCKLLVDPDIAPYKILRLIRSIATFSQIYDIANEPDPRFACVELLFVGFIGHLQEIPLGLREKIIITPIKFGLKSNNKYIRIAAVRSSIVVFDKGKTLQKALEEALEQETDREIQNSIISSLFNIRARLKLENVSFQQKYASQYPQGIAYGYYFFVETFQRIVLESRLWEGENSWERDKRYLLHLETPYFFLIHRARPKKNHVWIDWDIGLWKEKTAGVSDFLYSQVLQAEKMFMKMASEKNRISEGTLTQDELEQFIPYNAGMSIFDLAIHCHTASLLNPGNAKYHFEAFYLYDIIGMNTQAVSHLDEALKLEPDRAIYRMAKAGVLFKKGLLEEADREIEKIRKKGLTSHLLLEVEGKIKMARQEWDKAEDAFTHLHILYPYLPDAKIYLGHVKLSLGQKESARENFQEGMELIEKEIARLCRVYRKDEIRLRPLSEEHHIMRFQTYLLKAQGNYLLGMARIAAMDKQNEKALKLLQDGIKCFSSETSNLPYSPFTKRNLRRYPEFSSLMSHSWIQSLPETLMGMASQK